MNMIESFPSWFLLTPGGREMQEERQEHDRVTRQGLVDTRESLLRDRREMLSRHEKELQPVMEANETAQKRARTATEKVGRVRGQQLTDLHQNAAAEKKITRELLSSVDPRITEARAAMNRKWDAKHGRLGEFKQVSTGRILGTGEPEKKVFSNEGNVRRLLDAVKTARTAFDGLAYQNPDSVSEAISSIEAPVDLAWAKVAELELIGQAA